MSTPDDRKRLQEFSIHGDDNIMVAGDLHLLSPSPNNNVLDSCPDIEHRINKAFPKGFRSPSRNSRYESFSCELFLVSLFRAGIPVKAAVAVLQKLPDLLQQILENTDSEPSTRHIRQAVILAIERLSNPFSVDDIKEWRDRYSRQYGYPDNRILIRENNGEIHELSHKFLREELLPHVIAKALNIDYNSSDILGRPLITGKQMNMLSYHLMDILLDLGIYEFRYKTVFALAMDLFTRPPRLWLIDPNRLDDFILYHLKNADLFHSNIDFHESSVDSLATTNVSIILHSIESIIYHSTAAILAMYGRAIASEEISGALTALRSTLKSLLHPSDNSLETVEFEQSSIKQLPFDLILIEIPPNNLYISLGKIIQRWSKLNSKIYYIPEDTELRNELVKIFVEAKILYKISAKLYEVRKWRNTLSSVFTDDTNCAVSIIDFMQSLLKAFGFTDIRRLENPTAPCLIARPPRGALCLNTLKQYRKLAVLVDCGRAGRSIPNQRCIDSTSLESRGILLISPESTVRSETIDNMRIDPYNDTLFISHIMPIIEAFNSLRPFESMDRLLNDSIIATL